jgi:hypothetical protein
LPSRKRLNALVLEPERPTRRNGTKIVPVSVSVLPEMLKSEPES